MRIVIATLLTVGSIGLGSTAGAMPATNTRSVEPVFEASSGPQPPRSLRLEEIKRPLLVEEIKRPLRLEEIKRPLLVEEIKRPLRLEEIKRPLLVEEFKRPLRQEEFKRPLKHSAVNSQPLEVVAA